MNLPESDFYFGLYTVVQEKQIIFRSLDLNDRDSIWLECFDLMMNYIFLETPETPIEV